MQTLFHGNSTIVHLRSVCYYTLKIVSINNSTNRLLVYIIKLGILIL